MSASWKVGNLNFTRELRKLESWKLQGWKVEVCWKDGMFESPKKVECAAIGGFGGSLPRLTTIPTCRRSSILESRVLISRTSQRPDRREFGTAKFLPPTSQRRDFAEISISGPSGNDITSRRFSEIHLLSLSFLRTSRFLFP